MPIPMRHLAAIFVAAVAITAHAQQIVVSKDNRTIAVTTSADANATPPASIVTIETGLSPRGRNSATAIISRKNAHKFPNVLAS